MYFKLSIRRQEKKRESCVLVVVAVAQGWSQNGSGVSTDRLFSSLSPAEVIIPESKKKHPVPGADSVLPAQFWTTQMTLLLSAQQHSMWILNEMSPLLSYLCDGTVATCPTMIPLLHTESKVNLVNSDSVMLASKICRKNWARVCKSPPISRL